MAAPLGSVPPSPPAGDLSAFEYLDRSIYVLDIEALRLVWANAAALSLWRADSLAELSARDLSADLSAAAHIRLDQYRTALQRGDHWEEPWTLYPAGTPVTVQCRMRPIPLQDGRSGLLVEASPLDSSIPADFVRGLEALRHGQEAVSLYAADGRCLMRNPAALARFGGDAHRFADRFASPSARERVLAALSANGVVEDELPVTTDLGPRRHSLTVRRTRDPISGDEAILVCERDVTQRRETEAALSQAEAASDAKTAFLSTVSHELRTPLNAILGFAQVLTAETYGPLGDDRYRRYADDILASARHLQAVVADILDMARVEAGRLVLAEETVSIPEITRQSLRLAAPDGESAQLSLIDEVSDDVAPVRGDPVKLKQVLLNLLGNAIKAVPAGGAITVSARQGAHGATELAVRDTGPGVDPRDIPRMLAPFGRPRAGQAPRNPAEPRPDLQIGAGLGLGLPLAKAIVEAHGGTLAIDSQPGAGTTVTVTLPAERRAAS